MARGERRKCKGCLKLFRPDPRNRRHQHYCSAPACKAASKAASQARWLAAPENQNYFRGPIHVARVRAWRSRHPGYWRRAQALQDLSMAQAVDSSIEKGSFVGPALQELLMAQPAVLIGLIAHLVGTPLQDPMPHAALDLLCRTGNYAASSSLAPAMPAICLPSMRHSFGQLQALQKLKQFVGWLESAWNCIDRRHLGQSCFLQGEVGIQVDLRGLDRFVTQPKSDNR